MLISSADCLGYQVATALPDESGDVLPRWKWFLCWECRGTGCSPVRPISLHGDDADDSHDSIRYLEEKQAQYVFLF